MNLHHLLIFHTVATAGSVTAAAEQLATSQPAVSRQLATLERSLKAKLVDRGPRGATLTEAGRVLVDYARRIFALESEATIAMAELRGLGRGRLWIGASLSIGSYLLPGELGRFRRAHPKVEIEVEIANTHEIQHRLIEGRLDLGLTEGLVETDELESQVFAMDELVVIAPPAHALARAKRVTLKMLAKQPLIVREVGSGTREIVEQALEKKGVRIRPALTLGSTEAIKGAVMGGMGLAIVSRLILRTELQAGLLKIVKVADLRIPRELHLVRRKGRSLGFAANEMVRMLTTQSRVR